MGKRVKSEAKRVGILLLATFFLMVGLVGLLVPLLNGIIFILLSLVLFSVYSETAKKALRKMGKQHPKAEAWVVKMEKWVEEKIKDAVVE